MIGGMSLLLEQTAKPPLVYLRYHLLFEHEVGAEVIGLGVNNGLQTYL